MSELKGQWIARFSEMAQLVSTWSEDPSTGVGAVIVTLEGDILSTGWNGLPRGVKQAPERFERPEKYYYFEHAERNAIYNATRNGVSLRDSCIVTTHFPCPDCARGIIQSGIKTVYYCEQLVSDKWKDGDDATIAMLLDAKVGFKRITKMH